MLRSRFVPHVSQEIFKRAAPAVADGDTSAAVPGVLGGVWVITPLSHAHPRAKFRALPCLAGVPMFQTVCAAQTTTALRTTVQQVAAFNRMLCTAGTQAAVGSAAGSRGRNKLKNCQLSVRLPNEIRKVGAWHSANSRSWSRQDESAATSRELAFGSEPSRAGEYSRRCDAMTAQNIKYRVY